MKYTHPKRPKPGTRVVLTKEPPNLLQGLSFEEQKTIVDIIGKPILLVGYDADDRAELEFADRNKIPRFIYVDPVCINLDSEVKERMFIISRLKRKD